jgi:hypothetical protein
VSFDFGFKCYPTLLDGAEGDVEVPKANTRARVVEATTTATSMQDTIFILRFSNPTQEFLCPHY